MIVIKAWYHLFALIQHLLYKLIYGKFLNIGKNVTWRRGFSIMKTKEAVITIGDNCFFNNDCSIAANSLVEIGEGCLFGECVKIYDHNHKFNKYISLKQQGYSDGEVHIGKHCWIGNCTVILKNSIISDNCVIGAGCVISGYVPKGSIIKASKNYRTEKIKFISE